MAITHSQATKDSWAQDVLNIIDGNGNGNCVLKAASTPAATIPLLNPSFTRTNDQLVLITTTDREDTSAAGGTPDNFTFESGTAVEGFSGTIPDDLTLSTPTIPNGGTVRLTDYTYNAPK